MEARSNIGVSPANKQLLHSTPSSYTNLKFAANSAVQAKSQPSTVKQYQMLSSGNRSSSTSGITTQASLSNPGQLTPNSNNQIQMLSNARLQPKISQPNSVP
jgi:hypothetical protein